MKRQEIRTKRVVVEQTHLEVMNKDGWGVTVILNGHRMMCEFFFTKDAAEKRARWLRRRPIPKHGEIVSLHNQCWVPHTSCNKIWEA